MSTDMVAFVEYDRVPSWWREAYPDPSVAMPPPFHWETYSVSQWGGLYTGSKDYLFFGAVAGVRTDKEPRFRPRGMPLNLSGPLQRYLREDGQSEQLGDFASGWLTLGEIHAALDHHGVDRRMLSFETHTILHIMENLMQRVGEERVRLVFGFW